MTVEVVRELARRFAAGGDAFALFHPDIAIEQPASLPHGGWHRGREGVVRMGKLFGEHWTRTITDPRIFGEDASAVQITTQTWTSRLTGRSATVDVTEVFGFTAGLVGRIRVFPQDTHLLLSTLEGR